MASRAWLGDTLLVAGLKTAISIAVLATGFRALSDDDFARIVIGERFAYAPSFDPSGTSWLPFPFWIQGGVMMAFGRSITSARVTAFVLGVAGALLLWTAARWLGASRRSAIAGAVVGSAFPYAAWLGVATIPEAFTGALVVFGVASLSRQGSDRIFGAVALSFACLSRYEPWPVALVFAVYCALDGVRDKRRLPFVAGALAVLGAIAWLIHGALAHGDPWFFIHRVAAYRRAVGGGGQGVAQALFAYPLMLFRCEPEVAALGIVAVVGAIWKKQRGLLVPYRRGAVALAGLMGFLVVGELRDSAPTHHAERALFAIWLFVCLFATNALIALLAERNNRLPLGGALLVLVALGASIVRPWYARRDSFINRTPEVTIGKLAKVASSSRDTLLIDHPDFGFYAVIAAFGAPERAKPIDDHDPRAPKRDVSVRETVRRERATLVVLSEATDRALPGGLDSCARSLGETHGFRLIRCTQ
jgi:hypothetical protein